MRNIERGGGVVAPKGQTRQLLSLPDDEKRSLAYELLDEFGAQNMSERDDEITLSCCIPNGLHANGDSHPSASYNWRKMVYHCYACGASGGIKWFIGTCRGNPDISDWLAAHQIEDDPDDRLLGVIDEMESLFRPEPYVSPKKQLPIMSPSVLDQFGPAPDYMRQRRIPEETLTKMRVGFDPREQRVIIPHFWKGDLVGWQSRRLLDDGSPKYRNTPDFPKRDTLYNLPSDNEYPLLVVESPMSVLSKMHLYPYMVATFGASVTANQISVMKSFPKVVLWFDNDNAGWMATRNVAEALSAFVDVQVVNSNWNADPADVTDGDFAFSLEHNRLPYIFWQPPTQLVEYR